MDSLMSIIGGSDDGYSITFVNELQHPRNKYWVGVLTRTHADRRLTVSIDVGKSRSRTQVVSLVIPDRFKTTEDDKAFLAVLINSGLPEKYHVSGDAVLNAALIMYVSACVPNGSVMCSSLHEIPLIFDFDITLESVREQALLLRGATMRATACIKDQIVQSFRNPDYKLCRQCLLKQFNELVG